MVARRFLAFLFIVFFVAACLTAGSRAGASESPPTIQDIHQIDLPDFVNYVAAFSDDGRTATIIKAWNDENGGGHWVYLVTLPVTENIVEGTKCGTHICAHSPVSRHVVSLINTDVDTQENFTSTIEDNPQHDAKAVGFFRGTVDGKKGTYLLIAKRVSFDGSPGPIHFAFYSLKQSGGIDFETNYFEEQKHWVTTQKFCGASQALRSIFNGTQQVSTSNMSCRP